MIEPTSPGTSTSGDEPVTSPSGHVRLLDAVVSAVALALVSVIPVAIALVMRPSEDVASAYREDIGWAPMAPLAALLLAAMAVIPAALVGGLLGGLVWRWRRFAGEAVALTSAWAVGIVVLPFAAAILGVHLRAGISCVLSCGARLRDDQPLLGPNAYVDFLNGSFVAFWLFVLPASVVLLIVYGLFGLIRRRTVSRPRPPAAVALLVFAAVHGGGLFFVWDDSPATLIPYVALTLGVLVWGARMHRRRAPGQTPDEPVPGLPRGVQGGTER